MSTLSNQSLLEIKNIIAEISLQAAKVIMQNKNSTIKIKEDEILKRTQKIKADNTPTPAPTEGFIARDKETV